MEIKSKLQSGSAIIITMLFGTVAIGITLFLASISVGDYSQIASIEESGTAAYANEAATEFLLGAYTYDRSISLACKTDKIGSAKPTEDIYLDTNGITLKDSANNTVYPCNSRTEPSTAGPQVDTKIKAYYFKKGKQTFTFDQNEAKDFAVPKVGDNSSIYVVSPPRFIAPKPVYPKLALEVTFIGSSGDQKNKKVYNVDSVNGANLNNYVSAKFMRIRPFLYGPLGYTDTTVFTSDSKVSIDISFYLTSSIIDTNLSYFDSGTTTIETSTEFGSTVRKYITTIDRQSGTVVNQGDFVIYGNNDVTVQ